MKAIVAVALALGLMSGAAQAQHRSHGHHGQHHAYGHQVQHHFVQRHHSHHNVYAHRSYGHVYQAPVYHAPVVSYGHVYRPAYAPVYGYGHGQRVVIQQPAKVVAAPIAAAPAPVQAIEPQQDLKSAEGQISTGPAAGPAPIEAASQPAAPAPIGPQQ